MAFDLSGLLHIQKQYLADLSGVIQASNGQFVDKSPYVDNLRTQLDNLYTTFGSANNSANPILDHQADMSRIVQKETDRLNMKKNSIDGALDGQKRMLELNESYRKRYAAYTTIIITIVVVLTLFAGVTWLGNAFPIIPSVIVDIISVILFSGGVIYIAVVYNGILNRDKMNYDRLDLPPPKELSTITAGTGTTNAGLGLFDMGLTCIGEQCCTKDVTKYDDVLNKCVPITKAPFTLMSGAYKGAGPSGPSEFVNYSRV
jgi:hypothetical protein